MPKPIIRDSGENVLDKLIKDGHAQRAREAETAQRTEKHREMRLNARSKIINRKLELCQARASCSVDDNIVRCHKCHDFSLWCSSHSNRTNPACHHYRVLMVAGACSGSDCSAERAAVGITWGQDAHSQYSHAITLDAGLDQKTTTQRSEIWAATWGLQFFAEIAESDVRAKCHHRISKPSEWIVATSSGYVVEGMTKWLPIWKKNGLKTTSGKSPANIELFVNLDNAINELERRMPCTVGFWYIPQIYNLADNLAREEAHLNTSSFREENGPEATRLERPRGPGYRGQILKLESPAPERSAFLKKKEYYSNLKRLEAQTPISERSEFLERMGYYSNLEKNGGRNASFRKKCVP